MALTTLEKTAYCLPLVLEGEMFLEGWSGAIVHERTFLPPPAQIIHHIQIEPKTPDRINVLWHRTLAHGAFACTALSFYLLTHSEASSTTITYTTLTGLCGTLSFIATQRLKIALNQLSANH